MKDLREQFSEILDTLSVFPIYKIDLQSKRGGIQNRMYFVILSSIIAGLTRRFIAVVPFGANVSPDIRLKFIG